MDKAARLPPLFYLLARRRFKKWSDADIKEYQDTRMRKIVRFASRNSKFFENLYKGVDIADIDNLPTTNKKMMMDNLTDYNTLGLVKEELEKFCVEVERDRAFDRRFGILNIGMSSGTSGNKGIVITHPREEKYLKAAFFARFKFPDGEKLNLAFILRITVPAFNFNLFGHRLTYVSQLQTMDETRCGELSVSPFSFASQLAEINPNVISAPPSMLRLIAIEQREGRLKLAPKKLISYAEVLYPDVKRRLEETFSCPVHEIYQASEGSVAISCREGGLHINEDLVKVETLNADGSQTPVGQPCTRMLITDLHKQSQPVIRYELNDIVTLSKNKCVCGSNFRLIESIQGRQDDLFWGKRKHDESKQYIFPDYIRRSIIVQNDVAEYQAIQTDTDNVKVIVSSLGDETSAEAIKKNIQQVFRKYDCIEPTVTVTVDDQLCSRPSHSKHRRILFKPADKEDAAKLKDSI